MRRILRLHLSGSLIFYLLTHLENLLASLNTSKFSVCHPDVRICMLEISHFTPPAIRQKLERKLFLSKASNLRSVGRIT
ncbi:hypothetical protein B0H66DRAFT_558621 [Apodospora peruviana]|uniref:Secreted protein n=1 Tax=Apodospora peruviana TaxID=516989 RepID=A0AAE0M4K9_9PEZI|nr:hypothetical protein B0H66DRAFT_558621 [Apodospora peruviana]